MIGYFLTADILGFSRIMTTGVADVDDRIAEWTDLVQEVSEQFGIPHVQLMSDTLFAATPSDEAWCLQLLRFSQAMLERGVRLSIPIRGAIGHGEFTWGALTYGEIIIRCHLAEHNQNWIGICCVAGTPIPNSAHEQGLVATYQVPCKTGPLWLRDVIRWDVPEAAELIRATTGGGLTRGHEDLTHEWLTKINSTLIFRCYMKLLEAQGAPSHLFRGLTPLELIEAHVEAGMAGHLVTGEPETR